MSTKPKRGRTILHKSKSAGAFVARPRDVVQKNALYAPRPVGNPGDMPLNSRGKTEPGRMHITEEGKNTEDRKQRGPQTTFMTEMKLKQKAQKERIKSTINTFTRD